MQIPAHLKEDFKSIQEQLNKFNDDLRSAYIKSLPVYMSVPRYVAENQLSLSYEEQCEMGEEATKRSLAWHKPVRQGNTAIGTLNCYLEEILDSVLKDMTDGDETAPDCLVEKFKLDIQ